MPNAASFSTVMAENAVRVAVETAHALGKRAAAHFLAADLIKPAVCNRLDMIYHCNHANEKAFDMLEAAKNWVLTGPALGVIVKCVEASESADDLALQLQINELKNSITIAAEADTPMGWTAGLQVGRGRRLSWGRMSSDLQH